MPSARCLEEIDEIINLVLALVPEQEVVEPVAVRRALVPEPEEPALDPSHLRLRQTNNYRPSIGTSSPDCDYRHAETQSSRLDHPETFAHTPV